MSSRELRGQALRRRLRRAPLINDHYDEEEDDDDNNDDNDDDEEDLNQKTGESGEISFRRLRRAPLIIMMMRKMMINMNKNKPVGMYL